MNGKIYPVVDDFSLAKSGIFYKLVFRLGLGGTSVKHTSVRILFLIAITWLPLLALTALQGLAFDNKVDIPFWKDFATHSKFLVIIPLLLYAEGSFDFRLDELTIQFFKSGILDETDLGKYEEIKKKIIGLTESIWPDILMLLFIIINVVLRLLNP